MVVVTHAMSYAKNVANKIFLFARGVVAESGPPAQIFEAPQQTETKLFLQELGSSG